MALQFHWRLIEGGETRANTVHVLRDAPEKALPDLPAQIQFCREAEQCGIDSLLVDINFGKPDPITLALALCKATTTMKFMVACRPGLMSPTLFVQQVNTFSALMPGRISLNIVAGHSPQEQQYYGDHLTHDERYARMDEFLTICHAFWREDGPVNFHGKYYTIEDGRLNTPFVSPRPSIRPSTLGVTRCRRAMSPCGMRRAGCVLRTHPNNFGHKFCRWWSTAKRWGYACP